MGRGAEGGGPHLQHGDLHLVVAVRGVGGRDDEEAAFLVELIQQAGGRVHGRVDLHGWAEKEHVGRCHFAPHHPFPTPSPCRAASHPPSTGHRCGQILPCPTPLTCTKGLGARPLLGGLADAQGRALTLVAPVAQVLAGGPVVIAIGGAGEVAVLRRLQDGAAPHWEEGRWVRVGGDGARPQPWGTEPGGRQPAAPGEPVSPWTRTLNLQLARLYAWSWAV